MGPHCGAYYSNCAVIGHFTCQMATSLGWAGCRIVTRPYLSGKVRSGHKTILAMNNSVPNVGLPLSGRCSLLILYASIVLISLQYSKAGEGLVYALFCPEE